MKPLVSIIMPTYNRSVFLNRAIKSVLNQNFNDWELIIIDDASTDDTVSVVNKWHSIDGRIKLVRNEKNNYPDISKNLNLAINKAEGKYIARLDDDDYWCDGDKLKTQVEFLEENPNYVLVGGGVIVVDENEGEKFRYLKREKDEEIRQGALLSNPFSHTTVLYLKSAAGEAGFYGDNKYAEDWELWLKLGKIGKFYNFKKYFTCYTMSEKNKSPHYLRPYAANQLQLALKYRDSYPNFLKAVLISVSQFLYSFFPLVLRNKFNVKFSRLKRSL